MARHNGETYASYLDRKRREYGDRFNPPPAADHFGPYLHSGQRVKVRLSWGEEKTGTIGITTGWGPVFLLMSRSSAIGSSVTLGDRDRIVAVQIGRTYVPR